MSTVTPPEWLNAEIIQTALRNGGKANCVVENVTVSLAAAEGEHYSSAIYRVKATLLDGEVHSLIVKCLPAGTALAETKEAGDLFIKEAEMQADILPKLEAILNEAIPGQRHRLSAACPLYGSKPIPFFVMEDLAPQGFKMAERRRGLGLRHCLVAVRALARFHAAGHALLRADPALPQRFPNYFRSPLPESDKFFMTTFASAADVIGQWPGFEECSRAIREFAPRCIEIYTNMNDPVSGGFNALLHSDYWTNNMMFKYDDDGRPCDHRAIDTSGSHVTSPVIDLIYFLGTSPNEEVSSNCEDLLIREYNIELQETLRRLGLKGPSLAELLATMDEYGAWVYFTALIAAPLIRAEKAADIDSALRGNADPMAQLFHMPSVRRWLQHLLPRYSRRGWLRWDKWTTAR